MAFETMTLPALLAIIVLSFVYLIFWIYTLVHQAKRERWAWFVLTLIFQITLLIYWIVWLTSPKFKRKK